MVVSQSPAFSMHTSFADLAPLYDGFILDQFGVMHNGKESLPGAADLVRKLASTGKKLVILSNTSSPSSAALAKLPKMGFNSDDFIGAVTSGEEAAKYISTTYSNKKALLFTWKDNPSSTETFLKECGNLKLASSPDDADFVIAHGMQAILGSDGIMKDLEHSLWNKSDFSEIDPILKACAERRLPMVNANPDFVCIVHDGSQKPMPGKIAERYQSFGGECTYFGKPHLAHFEACVQKLGLSKDRVAHVGDSIHHDIVGANKCVSCNIFKLLVDVLFSDFPIFY